MSNAVNRGGRVAIAYARGGLAEARRLARALDGYRPPTAVAEMESEFGFAPERLEVKVLPRPQSEQDIDLPADARSILREVDQLIVLCSATAVEDRFIDEKIRTFMAYRNAECAGARLHLVQLPGEGEGEGEKPLPAAAVEAGARTVSDLSPERDGWAKGLDRVRAATLGIPFERLDALERAQAKRRRLAALIGLGAAALAVGVALVWLAPAFL